MKSERKSNFELLKIIAMFWIVLYHCYVHSGFVEDMSNINIVEIITQSICMFGVAGNVIFALISGYFLINSKEMKFKKIIQIVLQVWFYSFIILFLFLKLNVIDITGSDIMQNLMPLSNGTNWYITFYFLLCLFAPYINNILKNISKQSYKKLLLIMFVVWCVFGTIKYTLFLSSEFVYYIFIYCVGAYISLYEKDITITKKKSILFFAISVIVTILAIIVTHILKLKWNSVYELGMVRIFKSHPSIFQFFIGLFMFFIFKNINIHNNKLINTISSCTLGIYLLHENYFIRRYIWIDIFKLNLIQGKPKIILFVLLSCLIVFSICVIIELIRKKTIEKFYMKQIERKEEKIKKLKNKIDNFLNKILIHLGLEKSV